MQERTAALRETNAALQSEIAERGRIEASLRREKALSDTIIETLPGLFYVIDGAAAPGALESRAGEGVGLFAARRSPAVTRSTSSTRRCRAGAGASGSKRRSRLGHATAEADLIAKDGRRHPRLFTSKRVELDQATYLIGVGIDIAARREAEERVQHEKLLSDTIIDTLPGIFYLFDDQGHFLRWNENFERVSQFSAAEVAAMSPLDFFVGADREHIYARIQQVFRDGVGHRAGGLRRQRRYARRRISSPASGCSSTSGRAASAWASTSPSASWRRRRCSAAPQELARSNADLEQFAYVASHDLQEPLRAVASYTQLLARRYQHRLDGDAQRFIERTTAAVARMQALIRDLLAYSRVGTRGEHFEPTDCESVLRDVLDDLQAAVAETGAVVTHDPLPIVPADASQVRQLFQNLIGNAIKFRRDEPPRVHIARAPGRRALAWCRCATTASASSPSTPSASSSSSSACTAAAPIRAPASAWRSARRSSSGTAVASGSSRRPARARPFCSSLPAHAAEPRALARRGRRLRPPRELAMPLRVLLVEDNPDDAELLRETLAESRGERIAADRRREPARGAGAPRRARGRSAAARPLACPTRRASRR